MKRILFIIAQNFKDVELLETMAFLEHQGYKTQVASEKIEFIIGVDGARIMPDMDLEEVIMNLPNFKAVVFIGGPGAQKYFNHELCHAIAKEANEAGKVVAAICIAPVILAKAGILNGIKATVFTKQTDKHYADGLKVRGVKYVDKDVVVDRNIVTAKGSFASKKFAEAISKLIEE